MTHPDPTSSVAATPASRSPMPENAEQKPTNATSFPGSLTPFAYFDPDMQCWKTWLVTSQQDSEQYLGRWPRCGMTANGTAYQLPPSAHRIEGIDSSSLLWTPTAKANYSAPSFADRKGLSGYRSPTWVEWLMGFPQGWTDLEDLETPLSHKSQNTSEGS